MSFVVNSAGTMAKCCRGQPVPVTAALLVRVVETSAFVPAIWPLEVCNVLLRAVRRKRSRVEAVCHVVQPSAVDFGGVNLTWQNGMPLALRLGSTSSDPSYHEFAQRKAWPLVALDAAQQHAAVATGVASL